MWYTNIWKGNDEIIIIRVNFRPNISIWDHFSINLAYGNTTKIEIPYDSTYGVIMKLVSYDSLK